ncbi:protein of unknown function [Legionella hackeliae]|uniref:Uncharacterized protein n=2 Tax=Legionella hackeliae TaxID=449 RepID=A0A0A8UT31_LEGHA|nr:protein of unknown function [Legionella hackeliae]
MLLKKVTDEYQNLLHNWLYFNRLIISMKNRFSVNVAWVTG